MSRCAAQDAALAQRLADDAHGIAAGAAQIEDGGEIDDRLDIVLGGL
jgi:hypothetical protein